MLVHRLFQAAWLVHWAIQTYLVLTYLDLYQWPWLAVAVYLALCLATLPVLTAPPPDPRSDTIA